MNYGTSDAALCPGGRRAAGAQRAAPALRGIAQNHAAEIKLRAERRAGELLAEMDKHEGGRPVKTADTVSAVTPPTLEQLGISDKQSSRWQGIAAIPEPLFEATGGDRPGACHHRRGFPEFSEPHKKRGA